MAILTAGFWLLVLLAIYLWRKERKVWAAVTAAGIGLIVLLGAIGSATDDTTTPETISPTVTETQTTEEPPPASPATPKERVTVALGNEVSAGGYAGDVRIRDVSFGGTEVQVIAITPEGGFQGASCGDLNDGAEAIFVAIYDDGGWNGSAVVAFQGGLVSKATGEELPTANTGIFTMPASLARQINWSNEDALLNIDWSIYRDFCHPALK